jgi:hypothetical protein
LKNGSAIIPLLVVGVAATQFGVESVLLITPLILLAVAYALIFASIRVAGLAPPSRLQVLGSFWEEPGGGAVGRGERPSRA